MVWVVKPRTLSNMFSTKASINQTGLPCKIVSSKLVNRNLLRGIPVMYCMFKNATFLVFSKIILTIFE
jgi:hypothetical protein